MSAYNKLIGALAGNLVALVIAYLATKGLATCVTVGDASTCSVMGLTTAQITGALLVLVNSLFVYLAPPNTPTG